MANVMDASARMAFRTCGNCGSVSVSGCMCRARHAAAPVRCAKIPPGRVASLNMA